MNLQEELKALKERIAELEEQVEQEKEFPQDGDEYWSISDTGEIMGDKWDSLDFEKKLLALGNVYQTEQQAEFALEKLKVEAELRKFSKPYDCGKFDYCVNLDKDNDQLYVGSSRCFQSQGTIYFESKEKVQQAIEAVGEERIKKYLFGMED